MRIARRVDNNEFISIEGVTVSVIANTYYVQTDKEKIKIFPYSITDSENKAESESEGLEHLIKRIDEYETCLLQDPISSKMDYQYYLDIERIKKIYKLKLENKNIPSNVSEIEHQIKVMKHCANGGIIERYDFDYKPFWEDITQEYYPITFDFFHNKYRIKK